MLGYLGGGVKIVQSLVHEDLAKPLINQTTFIDVTMTWI